MIKLVITSMADSIELAPDVIQLNVIASLALNDYFFSEAIFPLE